VSVAVPARNEEQTISATLESLLAQTHPPDEIVVADGGSTDATVAVASRYSKRGVRILEIGPAYPGRARNEAIRRCRNEWIALIDAGCVAERKWLQCLIASSMALGSGPGIVFGEYRPRVDSEWDAAQALGFVGAPDQSTGLRPATIASSLVHKTAWEVSGGFAEDLRAAEDSLFIRKIQTAGVPVIRSSEAVVYWRLPRGPAGVFRRFRLYSAHHLAAGLFSTWHSRVMMMDGVGAVVGVASIFWPVLCFVLGGAVLARLLRTVARRRSNIGGVHPFRPVRLLRVGVLLLVADAAMWLGALDYALGREPPRSL